MRIEAKCKSCNYWWELMDFNTTNLQCIKCKSYSTTWTTDELEQLQEIEMESENEED